jgi:hypothetical protein
MERLPRRLPKVLVIAAAAVLAAAALGGTGVAGAGIEGHKITFRVTSPDVDHACVSYYETTEKGGPALNPPVAITGVDLPFKVTVGTGSKRGHWHITAYAAQDCESTDDPDGTVKCQLRVDGKVKAKATGEDQLVFCYV